MQYERVFSQPPAVGRRNFLRAAGAALAQAGLAAPAAANLRFGLDLFSLRSQKWTPFESLDYCAKRGVQVVHFSEIRFLGSLNEENVRRVWAHAASLGIELEVGMRSICPSSTLFDRSQGTAEEQLTRMLGAARAAGSPIVRCVLGSSADRTRPCPSGLHSHLPREMPGTRAVA
jgi:hypothetical protein